MKSMLRIVIAAVLSISCFISKAQNAGQMIKDWERAKAYTREYLDAMPEEGYAFKATPEIRSFAEHMLHFTDANFELGSLAGAVKNPIGEGAAGKIPEKSKAATTKMVMDGYDFIIETIKSMKSEQLNETIKVFGKYEMTRAGLFSKIFEHQTHHRGQTAVYLRLKGVTPPDEKLF